MNKKVNKNKIGRPSEYPYANMAVNQAVVLVYSTELEKIRSRGASSAVGYSHRWKFKSTSRKTDAGKFELTVRRLK